MPAKLQAIVEIVAGRDGEWERLWERTRRRRAQAALRAERAVRPILADVRRHGDRAVRAWCERFVPEGERFAPDTRVPAAALAAAWRAIPTELRRALRQAAANIERMARWQLPRAWMRRAAPGLRLGQIVRPIASVGCYVPGGRYPLPSTLLMTALPARVAGVPRLAVACPAAAPAVLAAAHLAGIEELYVMGGAQAIAALAYGTETIAPVAKIVGPGNDYVAAAKRLVAGECAIDFAAGPSEVLWVARGDEHAAFIAADLIAQSEHDPRASAWLVTPARRLARRVAAELALQLAARPNPVARAALRRQGAIVEARDLAQALAIANRLAPEHLTVPAECVAAVRHAGSLFLGEYSPQAAGDYVTGANHVLPTGGEAGWHGGLSAADFVKAISVQQLTRTGLRRLAPAIASLAAAEGLPAHAASVALRAGGEQ